MIRRCQHCQAPLPMSLRNPSQRFCGKKECQKARKRHWQRDKMRSDPDYGLNQRQASRIGRSAIPATGGSTAAVPGICTAQPGYDQTQGDHAATAQRGYEAVCKNGRETRQNQSISRRSRSTCPCLQREDSIVSGAKAVLTRGHGRPRHRPPPDLSSRSPIPGSWITKQCSP